MPRRLRPVSLAGLAAVLAAAAPAPRFDEAQVLADSRAAVGRQVSDLGFMTTEGRPVHLGAYRGRPVALNFIYTGCGDTCPLTIEHLDRAVTFADRAFGAGRFAVLTTSFDTRNDTPRQLRLFAQAHGIAREGWDVLSGDRASAERLAAEVGFNFVASAGGFAHLTQITLLDQDGRVYRQIYGENFQPADLVEPLRELLVGPRQDGMVRTVLNRIRLFCTVYDPSAGRYLTSYAALLEIVLGGLGLAAVAAFIVRLWRQQAKA